MIWRITVPVGKYFKGHGEEVLAAMKKQYGATKGKSVFYATINAKKTKRGRSTLTSGR